MGRLLKWVLLSALVIIVGGAVYLMFADLPVETRRIEKTIPNERLGL